ncbi:MAG: flavodoxin family protein [Candidatus Riflebacteria bacterium]|nr:flavodoxin family protein [Candidatus Riflebacteria bacterium]
MFILNINSSPRKNGNSVILSRKLCNAARNNGHTVKTVNLYDMTIKGCIACESCTQRKVEYCIHEDDLTKISPDIINADVLVFSTPIYMGHMNGLLKVFLDRWYTFAEEDFSIRHVMGKKFITITTSGAPAEQFAEVTTYFKKWFGEFFKLEYIDSIIAGELTEQGEAENRPELLAQAEKIGASL